MVHSGGFCDNMSRGGKRCRTQHGGGPYLTVDIMLGGRPGLFSTVNQGLCQDFQGGSEYSVTPGGGGIRSSRGEGGSGPAGGGGQHLAPSCGRYASCVHAG